MAALVTGELGAAFAANHQKPYPNAYIAQNRDPNFIPFPYTRSYRNKVVARIGSIWPIFGGPQDGWRHLTIVM